MKRILPLLLAVLLMFSIPVTVFAVEDQGESVDVTAKYIKTVEGEYASEVVDGRAEIELPDGTTVSITGIPEAEPFIKVIPVPQAETEAITWFEGVIEGIGTEPWPYMILLVDGDGNEKNANGVTVTMDIPDGINDPIVIAVDSDGTKTELAATVKDGKITFEADGSDFYVVAEKAASTDPGTDTPDDPNDPDDPVNPPSTGDDTMIWPWILLAVIACGMIFFLIFWKRRKKDENKA